MKYLQFPAEKFIPPNNLPALYETLRIFSEPLNGGCTIAGGFVRVLCKGESTQDYFSFDGSKSCGDIDIFLPSGKKIMQAVGGMAEQSCRSHAGFGWNKLVSDRSEILSDSSIKVQLIDHPAFCHDDPSGVIDRFDFVNVAIALSIVNGCPTITVDYRWKELEEKGLLGVRNSNSPFLGHRIGKYLKHRGYVGVTPESKAHIAEWIVKCAANEKFCINGAPIERPEVIKDGVTTLFEKGIAPREDVIMFLGRWNTVVTREGDEYGQWAVEMADWALNHLRSRE